MMPFNPLGPKSVAMPVDPSIMTPLCKHCRATLLISNVESGGERKEWVHDRDKLWRMGAGWDDRRYCVPIAVQLRMSAGERKQAEQYKAEPLDPNNLALEAFEDNPIASWRARSWE